MQIKNGKLNNILFSDTNEDELIFDTPLSHKSSTEEIMLEEAEQHKRKMAKYDPVLNTEVGDKSMDGLALGGALGGTVVGMLGAIVALTSTITIPGVNLIISGSLAAGLVGAGVGSITGGFLGVLIGFTIPEERIQVRENDLKKNGLI